MSLVHYLVFVGAALQLIGGMNYFINTLKGKTKPNRVTWLLWSVAPIVGGIAAITNGATWAIIPVVMAGVPELLIFFASFINKKAYWKLGKGDYLCGAFAVLALILWAITKDANIAIIFSIIADVLAAIPTIMKSWSHPETESGLNFILGTLAQVTGLIAIENWTFSEASFGMYLFLMDSLLVAIIYRKRFMKKKKPRQVVV
jgi:hypothetical protein